MLRAVGLAHNGIGFVNPNPLVGAVVVKNGKIIGEGWHERYGGFHAERNAIKNCTESPKGAEIYVTLEPCCHYGKNPPCTNAIIEAGIAKVYIGSNDPNPLVSGKGILQLRKAGINVVTEFCKQECDKLNDIFFHYITTNTPYCILKIASTADGKTATRTGKSKWITGEAARKNVHETRRRCAAIMTSIDTVLADDPMLNCRAIDPRHPIRIVCDTNLRIPLNCQLVNTAKEIPTYIATCNASSDKRSKLEAKNVNIIEMPYNNGHVDLKVLMKKLGEMNIDSVLIEAGAEFNAAALKAGIVNKLQLYIAPKIFGGTRSKSAVGGIGIDNIDDAWHLTNPEIRYFGEDLLIEYDILGEELCSQE